MIAPTLPSVSDPPGCWNAYVAAGTCREDRARRLAEAPEAMRRGIESHVRTVFAIRRYFARKAEERPKRGRNEP